MNYCFKYPRRFLIEKLYLQDPKLVTSQMCSDRRVPQKFPGQATDDLLLVGPVRQNLDPDVVIPRDLTHAPSSRALPQAVRLVVRKLRRMMIVNGEGAVNTVEDGQRQRFGPFKRPVRWSRAWVWAWGVVAAGLLISVWFRAPFMAWSIAALVFFGSMEGYGITHPHSPYPPLTQVIREYVPRWLAFSLIYGCTGLAAGTWFRVHNRIGLALITGLLGWFTAHFDTTFDNQAVVQESTKYAWYADRLGRADVSGRIMARRAAEPGARGQSHDH